jgi:DHA2 family multidrug resistance protein
MVTREDFENARATAATAREQLTSNRTLTDQALASLDLTLDRQARMLSTIDLFWLSGVLFLALAALVWLANAPRAAAKMAATPGSHE